MVNSQWQNNIILLLLVTIYALYKCLFELYVFLIFKFRLEKYEKRKQMQSIVQPLRYYGSH